MSRHLTVTTHPTVWVRRFIVKVILCDVVWHFTTDLRIPGRCQITSWDYYSFVLWSRRNMNFNTIVASKKGKNKIKEKGQYSKSYPVIDQYYRTEELNCKSFVNPIVKGKRTFLLGVIRFRKWRRDRNIGFLSPLKLVPCISLGLTTSYIRRKEIERIERDTHIYMCLYICLPLSVSWLWINFFYTSRCSPPIHSQV